MQARKASQRDWLVLTHHETGQEREGRGHTDSRTEQTTKAGPDCVNSLNSQAEKEEQRSMYLANEQSKQFALMCGHMVDTFPQYTQIVSKQSNN